MSHPETGHMVTHTLVEKIDPFFPLPFYPSTASPFFLFHVARSFII